ncbi:MAG: hypothetical protein IK144_12290 [Bacteroidaceae bacterium]|nr:hypothetical protein [Bacteroidaceae bacterium]
MLITTQNEIISLMPTARWDRPQQLFGYLEEEESVALEPLLGTTLYNHLLTEYDRLREKYTDITPTTVRPTKKAKKDARLAHADVTERLEQIQQGKYRETYTTAESGEDDVPALDLDTIRLIRICQQIEWYKMLAHKAGLLTVSFNEGGGMNMVSADGYEPADEKRMERVVKDAWMSAGRAVDSLLLFLENDAKGARRFTEKWKDADAFYLHKDLLFQTARTLNEYLDIKGERMAYVALVRDIRFCQNTYLKPRIGSKLLKAVIEYGNVGIPELHSDDSSSSSSSDDNSEGTGKNEIFDDLLSMLRTALAFFVEGRRTDLEPVRDKLSRRDSMTDAQQALAMACEFVEQNLEGLGETANGTPIYIKVMEKKAREKQDAAAAARRCRCKEKSDQNSRKIYTGFPPTHRMPERK